MWRGSHNQVMSLGKRTTLSDIAERAQTSTMAVSVVLNGARSNTRVSDATRQRILQVAAGLNYTPNAMARGLKRQRTNTLGVLFNWAGSHAIHNLYSVAVLDGIVAGAATAGYHILLYTQKWHTAAASASAFSDQRTDGVVVVAPNEQSDVVPGLTGLGLKVALVSSVTPTEGVPCLTIDNREGVRLALDHLWDIGHRRIAYIGHGWSRHSPRERYDAYREWIDERGLPHRSDEAILADLTPDGEDAPLHDLLTGEDRPTAVFAFNDDIAVKVLEHARSRGVSVPGDLSVVGFDDVLVASLTVPKLTTIRQPLFEMGRQAAKRLVARIEKSDTDDFIARHVLAPELVVRESTAPPRHEPSPLPTP